MYFQSFLVYEHLIYNNNDATMMHGYIHVRLKHNKNEHGKVGDGHIFARVRYACMCVFNRLAVFYFEIVVNQ